MPEGAQSLLMWEDNPDTPINASNLSKTIDINSESKFIYYKDDEEGYEKWADEVVSWTSWPLEGRGEEFAAINNYVGKTVYNTIDHVSKVGVKSDDETPDYSWLQVESPYKKLLKILPYTKIGMKYTNLESNIEYSNFDSGTNWQVFSVESLLNNTDFNANTIYYIYLYHYTTYGDYAKIKIVSDFDETNGDYGTNDWKLGPIDESSPTGHRVISYRKIGGFNTDANKQIIEDSIWDISLINTALISDSYKVLDNGEIREFQAKDIPINDDGLVYNSTNVETALQESRILLNSVTNDVYLSDSRFGVDLKFSPVKKAVQVLPEFEVLDTMLKIPENSSDISLKITAGYIDVVGKRVKIDEDIYLASTDVDIKINNGNYGINPIRTLGQETGQGDPDNNHTIFVGVWRVFISAQGKISISNASNRSIYRANLRGWYNIDGERCIGKFKVSYDTNHYFIEKMSVTGTYDERIPANTMFMYHGSMCPDGLLPCDGRWHDINGLESESYEIMPEINITSKWQDGSWFEDTPNMWDRTVKMIPSQELPFNTIEFKVNYTTSIVEGSSRDCGFENNLSASNHTHIYEHYHAPGELKIDGSGEHQHNTDDFNWFDVIGNENVVDSITGVNVASENHSHELSTKASGQHTHDKNNFSGQTEIADHNDTNPASSWSPYKEILFCIKK